MLHQGKFDTKGGEPTFAADAKVPDVTAIADLRTMFADGRSNDDRPKHLYAPPL